MLNYYNENKMDIPQVPLYPSQFKLEFLEGKRDKLMEKLKEVFTRRLWEQFGKPKEEIKKALTNDYKGIESISEKLKTSSEMKQKIISTSFTGLDNLRDSAKKLVNILH